MTTRSLTLQLPAPLELDSLGRELVAELLERGLRQWRVDRALDLIAIWPVTSPSPPLLSGRVSREASWPARPASEGSGLRRAPRPSRKSSLERHAQLPANTSGTRSRISFA